MEHYAPPAEITEEDRIAVAAYSSRGERPPETDGVRALLAGKSYREAHIAMYRRDIADGLLARFELTEDESIPEGVRAYLARVL